MAIPRKLQHQLGVWSLRLGGKKEQNKKHKKKRSINRQKVHRDSGDMTPSLRVEASVNLRPLPSERPFGVDGCGRWSCGLWYSGFGRSSIVIPKS